MPAVRALSPPTFSRQLAATPPDDVVLSGGGAAGVEPAAVAAPATAPETEAMDASAEEAAQAAEGVEEVEAEGVAMEAEAGPATRRHVIRHVFRPSFSVSNNSMVRLGEHNCLAPCGGVAGH